MSANLTFPQTLTCLKILHMMRVIKTAIKLKLGAISKINKTVIVIGRTILFSRMQIKNDIIFPFVVNVKYRCSRLRKRKFLGGYVV